MKIYISLISIFVFAAFIFSFTSVQHNTTASTVISSKKFHKPLNDKQFYAAIKETVPLDTVYVIGDSLHILTKKIQGCDVDIFKLAWTGAKSNASVPQTNLRLFKAVDPSCGEKHLFHLIYNISPLQVKRDTTANLNAVIVIGGWKRPVSYQLDSIPAGKKNKS